ncbi:MAG TPA: hypothetical protein PLU33_09070 [Treponemataceae bacterium]|nr:hypothetical protein [Treponemataceae bacterium]HQL05281.1 hypothetical protein [Treponemataceae bacterium]
MLSKSIVKFICIILVYVCVLLPCFSDDEADRWFWPLGDEAGEIIMRPGRIMNPVSGEAFYNYDYYISSTEGQPVYSPVDGYVSNTSPYHIIFPDAMQSGNFSSIEDFLCYERTNL